MKTIGSLLIALALMAGMLSCSEVAVSYELTVSSTAGGSVVEPGEGVHIYEEGTVVDLVAEPDTGHRFVDWTGDVGTVSSVTAASTTMTMNGDYSITANFEETPAIQYNLTISSTEGGSVTTPGEGTFTYDIGTLVNLVAAAEAGYRFVRWTGDVSTVANVNDPNTTITVNGDYTLTVDFEEIAPRMGAWVDEVFITAEPDAAQAALKLASGDIDMYAFNTYTNYSLLLEVVEHPEIDYTFSYGSNRDLRFNTYRDPDTKAPLFVDGRLNPFAVPEIREAMNWLIDRETIVATYMKGMGALKWTVLNTQFLDHDLYYEDIIADIEATYEYSFSTAKAVFDVQMQMMGATWDEGEGLWYYGGEPVEIIFVIRSDLPPFPDAGHYVADQVEALGFEVTRLVRPSQEAFAVWLHGQPAEGLFHVATGGWGTPTQRDWGQIFDIMYTHRAFHYPLWAILEEQLEEFPELDEAAMRLRSRDFTSIEERKALFETALKEAMRFSNCIWLCDMYHVNAYRHDVGVAVDRAAAGMSDPTWVHTVHFHDRGEPVEGGTLNLALHAVLVEPWNPVNARWTDVSVTGRALGDAGTMLDPRDGLHHPHRIESAAVTVWEQVPMRVTLPWVALNSTPDKIAVPDTAWADWDAENQVWIMAEQRKLADPDWEQAAAVRSVVVYPGDIYSVPLHDGSTLSLGDFVMSMIMTLDRGKPGSPVYDQSQQWQVESFLHSFKGVEIIHDGLGAEPLTVATYTDTWHLDAELNVTTWFPEYSGFWHMVTVGWLADKNGELAFSSSKADVLGVEWMDYTRGPSLPILKKWLDWGADGDYVPYAPTLGQYISADEAAERWANLRGWYEDRGHFWVGSGPFYLEAVYPAEKVIHLKRFEDYPDPADKWLFLLEPLP